MPTKEDLLTKYNANKEHAKQVQKYAEMIFDSLNETINSFTSKQKEYLLAAAYLHDIGYFVEKKSHHKHTMNLILENGLDDFSDEENLIIANIARYHRSSLPDENRHENYAKLSDYDKELVKKLGGILRIADGMDKPSKNLILRLEAKETANAVEFYIKTIGFKPKLDSAKEKSDLFEFAFNKPANFFVV